LGENGPGRRAEGGGLGASERRPQFYGRRRGRPLRAGRAELLDRLLPSLATPDPMAGPIRPDTLFPGLKKSAYWLEVGFGGGEHLVSQATANSDVGLIGAEPFVAGVSSCLAGIEAAGIENVRLHADDARPLMAALPEASMDKVFVLHPDPWRKRRHWERRLIGPKGLDAIARLLVDGGELRCSTDHSGYQVWMLRHLRADARFRWLAETADDWRIRPDDWPETRYEAKAVREGRPLMYLRFQRERRQA